MDAGQTIAADILFAVAGLPQIARLCANVIDASQPCGALCRSAVGGTDAALRDFSFARVIGANRVIGAFFRLVAITAEVR